MPKLLQILRRVSHVLPKLQLQGELMFANSLIDVSFSFFFFLFRNQSMLLNWDKIEPNLTNQPAHLENRK